MIKQSKILGLIGLSARARKIEFGADAVEESIKKRKVQLVIISEEASDKTKKNFKFLCDKYKIKQIVYGTKEEISKAIGKENKVIIAIKDVNLSDEIYKIVCGGEAIE